MQDTRAAAAGGGHWPTGKGRGAVSSATVQLCWRMETGGLAESSSGGTAAWRRRRLGGRRRGHGRWAGIGFSSVSIAAARLGNFMSRSRRRPSVCQDHRAGFAAAKEGKGIDKGTRRDVSRVVQMGRPARPVLGPARQTRLENRAGPCRHAGSISCPSPARSGPKRVGPTRLVRKNGPKNGLCGPVSTF